MKKTEVEPVDGVILYGVDANDPDSVIPIYILGNALNINQATNTAGERQTSSATLSYLSVKEDWNYAIVDLSVDSTVISAAPTILGNVWVETVMSAHTVAIADDAVTVKTLEAGSAVGTTWTQMKGLRCETNLTVTPNVLSTGIIHVLWRLL